MTELYPYQAKMRDRVREAFRTHKRVLLAAPCAAGKTVLAADMFLKMRAKGKRGIFIVDRDELVRQGSDKFRDIPHGIIKAGYPESRSLPLQVASIQTLVRRELPPADFAIIDEAHISSAASYRKVLDGYPNAWVLGITATPARMSGAPLSSVYETLIVGATERELIDLGYLIDPIVYGPPNGAPSTEGLRTKAGDWIDTESRILIGDAVEHWLALCKGRRTAIYTASRAHSEVVAAAFTSAGVRVAIVDGETPDDERRATLAKLAALEIDAIVNVDILTKGWDLRELSAIVVLRMTKSIVLHRQMIGRVMRTAPGKKDAIVLDHAGNTARPDGGLGFMSEPVSWSLDAKVPARAAPSLRTCRACFVVMRPGVMRCPECGAEPKPADREPPRGQAGELVRIAPADRRAVYLTMVQSASAKGWKLGAARGAYRDRFGVWPRGMKDVEAAYRCVGHEAEVKEFGGRRVTRCARCLVQMGTEALWK